MSPVKKISHLMALTVLLVTEAKFIYLENVHKEKLGTMISFEFTSLRSLILDTLYP